MRTVLVLLIILLALVLQLPAQQDWQSFKTEVNDYYMAFENSRIQNFSCLFTTGSYLGFAEEKFDSSYTYPLKLIWTKSGKMYYVLQPYPANLDSAQHQDLFSRVQMVSQQFKGFMLDWQNFLINSPFSDIPDDAQVDMGKDSVVVHYRSGEGELEAQVSKLFLPSGKLVQVVVRSKSGTIVNFPIYSELGQKWICSGWNSQIYKNGEITSGIASRIELTKFQGFWMPSRASMLIQTSNKPEEKFMTTIFLKDFQFDIPLQEIDTPAQPVSGN